MYLVRTVVMRKNVEMGIKDEEEEFFPREEEVQHFVNSSGQSMVFTEEEKREEIAREQRVTDSLAGLKPTLFRREGEHLRTRETFGEVKSDLVEKTFPGWRSDRPNRFPEPRKKRNLFQPLAPSFAYQ